MAEDREESGNPPRAQELPGAAWGVLGAASRQKADAFLDEQTALAARQRLLADLQIEDMQNEIKLRHWSLRFGTASGVMKLAFELSLAAVVTVIAVAIGIAVWSAAHDNGLVIESFAVPADLAADGLSGQVVATRIEDRLAWIQGHADTIRAPGTFRNDWGDDIKVQIPETGVSIGEFYRILVGWLGHQTRISGEVWRHSGQLFIGARASGGTAQVFHGTDLDALIVQAAEHVYGQTQPYRYAVFLSQQGRTHESLAVVRALALSGPAEERPWAYSQWGLVLLTLGDVRGALEKVHVAATVGPDLPHIHLTPAQSAVAFGHEEAGLRENRRALALLESPKSRQLAAYAVAASIPGRSLIIAEATGDFAAAIAEVPRLQAAPDYSAAHRSAPFMLSANLARNHDVSASLAAAGAPTVEATILQQTDSGAFAWDMPPLPKLMRAVALEDWAAVRADAMAINDFPVSGSPAIRTLLPVLTWPWLAYAEARLGQFTAAHALIDATPRDCDLCLRMRGNIAAAEKNWGGAEYWFARAVKQAPSIPFAYHEWGAMLLAKGDRDGAIAKFAAAHAKGPHFADPLELWGEALIAKNRSDLALAKFAEANQYAPNWGRLHLKWGEALFWTGRTDEAKTQFARAAQRDLPAADKAALAAWIKKLG